MPRDAIGLVALCRGAAPRAAAGAINRSETVLRLLLRLTFCQTDDFDPFRVTLGLQRSLLHIKVEAQSIANDGRNYFGCFGCRRLRNRTPGPPPFLSMKPLLIGFVSLIAA